MKKSTIVLTITGVVFTIIGITCLVAASVKLADMGIDTAAGSLDGEEYTCGGFRALASGGTP